ncbi:FSHD region gene 2 family member 1 [Cricetulus griseus]
MMENPRQRKHSSNDSRKVRRGNEEASHSEKRQKTTAKEVRPKANGHQELACPEAQHTRPPPLPKTLVLFFRAMSEAVYGDIIQVQAQQHHFPLPQEKLSQLTQLLGSLSAMIQTFYRMAPEAPITSLLRAGFSQTKYLNPWSGLGLNLRVLHWREERRSHILTAHWTSPESRTRNPPKQR